jgi:hypothetical protein
MDQRKIMQTSKSGKKSCAVERPANPGAKARNHTRAGDAATAFSTLIEAAERGFNTSAAL